MGAVPLLFTNPVGAYVAPSKWGFKAPPGVRAGQAPSGGNPAGPAPASGGNPAGPAPAKGGNVGSSRRSGPKRTAWGPEAGMSGASSSSYTPPAAGAPRVGSVGGVPADPLDYAPVVDEDTSRKGQPAKPCTAVSAFKTLVHFGLPERVAWGFWACLNGMALSWVCSMFYDPGVTDTSTTLSAGIKKVRNMIRISFHPDKSPNNLAVVPAGTPSLEAYTMVFRELTDAVWLFESFMSMHPTSSVTLFFRDGNTMNTYPLDTFLTAFLQWIVPPVIDAHSKLHNWWMEDFLSLILL